MPSGTNLGGGKDFAALLADLVGVAGACAHGRDAGAGRGQRPSERGGAEMARSICPGARVVARGPGGAPEQPLGADEGPLAGWPCGQGGGCELRVHRRPDIQSYTTRGGAVA